MSGIGQSINVISDIAIICERDADGYDPEAYKVNLQKINNKWKVVTFEFGGWGGLELNGSASPFFLNNHATSPLHLIRSRPFLMGLKPTLLQKIRPHYFW
jgi:hypothetical protein